MRTIQFRAKASQAFTVTLKSGIHLLSLCWGIPFWGNVLFRLVTAMPLLATVAPVSTRHANRRRIGANRSMRLCGVVVIVLHAASLLIARPQTTAAPNGQSAFAGSMPQGASSPLALSPAQANTIAATSASRPLETNLVPNIPPGASPALRTFLTSQVALANAHAKIHNQLLQQAAVSPSRLSFSQLAQLQAQENHLFQQQNAALLNLQAQRGRALGTGVSPVIGGGAPNLPADLSPQMRTFLTTRYQIWQQASKTNSQFANASPAARQAALNNLYKQNAGFVTQLQQQARAAVQTPSSTQN